MEIYLINYFQDVQKHTQEKRMTMTLEVSFQQCFMEHFSNY